MPRIVLAAPTHRSYCYQWVRGLISVGWPEEAISRRLDALGGIEIRPAVCQGYGAARNMAEIVQSAVAQEADFVLSCEWDHAWDARHLCQILEAERFLRQVHGPVVVGAQYPGSGEPFRDVVRPLEMRGPEEFAALTMAAENLREFPEVPSRYVEAWLMPAGFALWPVALLRGLDIVERCGLTVLDYWDAQVSAACRAQGARLFVDLSLDVGHVPAVGVTSLEIAKFKGRNE